MALWAPEVDIVDLCVHKVIVCINKLSIAAEVGSNDYHESSKQSIHFYGPL